jgi:ligand-binding SRPBCC domain-containing protein
MFRLKESIHVNAPIDRCFLLSTSIALVEQSLHLRPVAGKTTGLIVDGEHVRWRGWKFGVPVWHESLITRYERPGFFQDTMVSGSFRHYQHDHRFEDVDGYTLLTDIVRFSMPLGPLGRSMGKHIVVPHILDGMLKRFQLLKRIAEGSDWERYIVAAPNSPASSQVAAEASRIQDH